MASITKRGNTWQYTVSYTEDGKYKPIRKGGFRTKKEANNLQKTSGHTAYANMTKAILDMSKNAPKPSSPKVIAEIVLKAIESKKPKTRYVAGQFAKPLMILRKLVFDRMYDRILYRMFKIN